MSRSSGLVGQDRAFNNLHIRQSLTTNRLNAQQMEVQQLTATDLDVGGDMSVGGSLDVTGESKFQGTTTFQGVTLFEGNAVFQGEIKASSLDASSELPAGHILVGNASNLATPVVMSGDAVIDENGEVTVTGISGILTGPLDMNQQTITNLPPPLGATDAATKDYVDTLSTNLPLPDGTIFVGNALDTATPVTMSGDVTITNTGVASVNNISGSMSSAIDMNNNPINNLAAPVAGTDAANKAYVDSVAQGLDPKDSCLVATTGPGTLSIDFANGFVVDGVTLATGDRILIKDQGDSRENGIYIVEASGPPARAADAVTGTLTHGASTNVTSGTANSLRSFVLTTADPITTDVSNLVWTVFSAPITASNGVTRVGDDIRLADVAANSVKARVAAGSGTPGDLVMTQGGLLTSDGTNIVNVPLSGLSGYQLLRTASGFDWAAIADVDLAIGTQTTTTLPITNTGGTGVTLSEAVASGNAGLLSGADKAKLDGIESGAQANVATNLTVGTQSDTSLEIASSTGSNVTLSQAAAGGNAGLLSGTDKSKLDGIAAGAQVNVATNLAIGTVTATQVPITNSNGTGATLPAAVAGVSAGLITAASQAKLDGIAAGAQVNDPTNLSLGTQTTTSLEVASSTGTNVTISQAVASGNAGLLSGADKAKLDGIAAGAQVNVPTNLSITSHTPTGLTLTSSTETSAGPSLVSAVPSGNAGLLTGADKQIIDDINTISLIANVNITTGNLVYVLSSNGQATNNVGALAKGDYAFVGIAVTTVTATNPVKIKISGTTTTTDAVAVGDHLSLDSDGKVVIHGGATHNPSLYQIVGVGLFTNYVVLI